MAVRDSVVPVTLPRFVGFATCDAGDGVVGCRSPDMLGMLYERFISTFFSLRLVLPLLLPLPYHNHGLSGREYLRDCSRRRHWRRSVWYAITMVTSTRHI